MRRAPWNARQPCVRRSRLCRSGCQWRFVPRACSGPDPVHRTRAQGPARCAGRRPADARLPGHGAPGVRRHVRAHRGRGRGVHRPEACQGHGLSSGLGVYSVTAQNHYSLREVARWSVQHLAELVFAVGFIPASRADRPRRNRVGCSANDRGSRAGLSRLDGRDHVLDGAPRRCFASRFALRIESGHVLCRTAAPARPRDLAGQGVARPPRLTAAADVVPAALLLSLHRRPFDVPVLGGTPGLVPLSRVAAHLEEGIDGARVLLALGVLSAGRSSRSCRSGRGWCSADRDRLLPRLLLRHGAEVLGRTGGGRARVRGANDVSWIDETIGLDADAAACSRLTSRPIRAHCGRWSAGIGGEQHIFLLERVEAEPATPAIPTKLNGAGRLVPAPGRASRIRRPRTGSQRRREAPGEHASTGPVPDLVALRLADRSSGLTADGWTGADATYSATTGCEGDVSRALASRRCRRAQSRAGRADHRRHDRRASGLDLAQRLGGTSRFRAPPAPFSVRIHVRRLLACAVRARG